MGYWANADVKIINNTSCTYILSIPIYGYFIVPPGNSQISPNYLVTDIKVDYWPAYPSGTSIDQVFVQLYTIPTGTSLYPSCSGSNYNCKYSYLSGNDTLLEIF